MIANISFDLDEPDDAKKHLRAIKADNAFSAIHEFKMLLRDWAKHGLPTDLIELTPEYVREKFYEILSDEHIDMEELF